MGSVHLQNPAHPAALLHKANQMRLSGTLCDVAIVVDGREFRAHRTVLACTSKMFEILFHRESARYTLDFLSPKTFGQILEYAYTSTLQARLEDLDDLLYAAEILEMEFLEEQCLKILETVQTAAEADSEAAAADQERRNAGGTVRTSARTRDAAGTDIAAAAPPPTAADAMNRLGTNTSTFQSSSVPALFGASAPNAYVSQSLLRGEGLSSGLAKGLNSARHHGKHHPITPSDIKTEDEAMQVDMAGEVRVARGSVITSARHLSHSPEEGSGGAEAAKAESGLMGVASFYGMPPVTANHIPQLQMGPPFHMQLDFGHYGGLLPPNFLQRDFLSKLVGITASDCRRRDNRCDVCGVELPDEETLEQHRKLHNEVRSYGCEVCGKTFLDSLRLRMHMLSHTAGEKAIVCDQCGAQFQKEEDLETHKQIHTGSDMAVFCLLCGKRFQTQSGLRQHTETHAGLRSYVCTDCDCTFPSNTALKRHLRSHTGDHPFECEFCGSCFRDDTTLKGHKRIHTGEKPYQCNSCGKKFSLKHQLETHYRVHTGEKPFECKLCHQRSRDYSAMIKHLRTHNGASPYQCTICQEYCPSLSSMQKHMKNHKPEDVPADWRIEKTYLYLCYV
ncbi:zinc finger and BTB domain-containing protein 16-A-like isoform X2 [Alosa sapidissima]|uniref:zinc finger and BTB domain-containing protein 16-A-like isoform X2 n=1 Tax=Alosa sapidissima TaxID=34773 RepID=UPI001C09B371|nr:zinc finger and BTB domain-containing protein 16-A-like isoform X2 [Alosa sapidissima]